MWSILLLIVIGIGAALLDLFKGVGKSFKSLSNKASNFAENARQKAVNAKEKRSLRIKHDNAINNSQCIEKINNYFELFKSNKELNTICKNSTDIINSSIWILEFAFIPYYYSILFEQKYRLNTKHTCEISNDFLSQVSLYNQDIIDKYYSHVKFAHTILLNLDYYDEGCNNYGIKKENDEGLIFDPYATNRELKKYLNDDMDKFSHTYLQMQEEIRELYDIFLTLLNQRVIECENNLYSFCAFLYLMYKYKKMSYLKISKKSLSNVGLTVNDSEESIISTMFENDLESNEIATTIWSLRSKKNNFIDLMNDSFKAVEDYVKIQLKDLKEKQKIEILLKKIKNLQINSLYLTWI